MLKLAIIGAVTILALPAVAGTYSGPIYPSFATVPTKPTGMVAPIYPSFHSPKAMTPSSHYTTFNVPGARNTEPFAINNNGVVTGVYSTSREFRTRGFVRAADEIVTTFDAPGWTSSNKYEIIPLSINDNGVIVGVIRYGPQRQDGFIRLPDGTIKKVVVGSGQQKDKTALFAIANTGVAAGTDNSTSQCFIRRASGVLKFINCGSQGSVSGINSAGTVTGQFDQGNDAYVRASDGTLSKFHADQVSTTPVGINSTGTIAGYFEYNTNDQVASYGFFRTSGGAITKFRVPGYEDTQPAGINDAGVIAGTLTPPAQPAAPLGFVRAADGTITTFQFPGGGPADTVAINNSNVIVGTYVKKGSSFFHGFILTP